MGVFAPKIHLKRKKTRRAEKFSKNFANALDVIIRGVRSGLPLGDCLKIIAKESPEPIKSEFKALVEDQTLGMPINIAVQRLYDRMPLPETSFFSIVLSIQAKTGGNLSETLANLARVLRERKKMRDKVKAMSSEAKASAGIIGSLPFGVSVILYFSSPDYISLLFSTSLGNFVLLLCAIWMALGIFVMKRMINFEI